MLTECFSGNHLFCVSTQSAFSKPLVPAFSKPLVSSFTETVNSPPLFVDAGLSWLRHTCHSIVKTRWNIWPIYINIYRFSYIYSVCQKTTNTLCQYVSASANTFLSWNLEDTPVSRNLGINSFLASFKNIYLCIVKSLLETSVWEYREPKRDSNSLSFFSFYFILFTTSIRKCHQTVRFHFSSLHLK